MNLNGKFLTFFSNIFNMLSTCKTETTLAVLRRATTVNGQEFKKALDFLIENNLVFVREHDYIDTCKGRRKVSRKEKRTHYYYLTEDGEELIKIYEEAKMYKGEKQCQTQIKS